MRRFFVSPDDINGEEIFISEPSERNHIKNVLRLQAGDTLIIADGSGMEYQAAITDIPADGVKLSILWVSPSELEPITHVTLFQSVPKQGKMETIIQKSVELGVRSVVPVITERSVPKGGFAKTERWQKISAEAAKQCGRAIIPKVAEPCLLSEMIPHLTDYAAVIFPYEQERSRSIKTVLRDSPGLLGGFREKGLALIIGPEGGFADEEAETLKASGALSCGLGRRILRTETAGPAAIAMIMYELEL